MTLEKTSKAIHRGVFAVLLLLFAGAAFAGNGVESKFHRGTRYFVLDLSSGDGVSSAGISINNLGWITGHTTFAGGASHATLWLFGLPIDLGTLGGPGASSKILWHQHNTSGRIVGISQIDQVDPLDPEGTGFSCRVFLPTNDGRICRGFVWEWGEMRELPPFPGGHNSFATAVNNHGAIVGWAETGIHDTSCVDPFQELQFVGAVWGPEEGQMRKLPPLPGDSASTGNAINDKGQVAGISGICDIAVGRFSARNMVVWDKHGNVTDIGDLGGVAWHTPMAINEHGVVVGFSNPNPEDGGAFNEQAFIWSEAEGTRNLGTLPGDENSQGLGINDQGTVVGLSFTRGVSGTLSAVIWRDGQIMDLNSLVLFGSDHLLFANDINESGVITGQAVDPDTGEEHAFWAIPIPGFGKAGSTSM